MKRPLGTWIRTGVVVHVGEIAGRKHQDAGTPGGNWQCVQLAGSPTARRADVMREGPRSAPAVEPWTLMLVESIGTEPQTPVCVR